MYKFKILVEGYARAGLNGSYYASPTTTLIYSDNFQLIVDPGTNSTRLLESLNKENMNPTDIKMIFLTHYHPDHFLNLKLFPNAILYDGTMIWKEDEENTYSDKIPNSEIEVVHTPGHTMEQASLVFKDEEDNTVFLCQDVFWWEDGKQDISSKETLLNNPDPFMVDWKLLQESRELVLQRADIIIPGHGVMFRNKFKRKV